MKPKPAILLKAAWLPHLMGLLLFTFNLNAQTNPIFNGGNSDGFAQTQYAQPDNNNIFAGGSDDGFSQTSFEQNASNSIFKGGNADGHDQNAFEEPANNNLFSGGSGDGFDQLAYEESTNNTIFAGGNADGFEQNNFEESTANSIFAGGDADGYEDQSYEQDASNNVFGGGSNDGFDDANYEEPSANSIFAGGQNDGFSTQGTNTTVGLPVELLYFKAIKHGDDVKLKWATASEKNADHFQIQRKGVDQNFKTILTQQANGTSFSRINYHDFDHDPIQGHNYYRLKEVDQDGKQQLSKVVHVLFREDHKRSISIYPNPVKEQLHVHLYGFQEEVAINFKSLKGKPIIQQTRMIHSKDEKQTINLPPGISEGLYLVQVVGVQSGKSEIVKVIVK